jgi:cell division protein FtsQ
MPRVDRSMLKAPDDLRARTAERARKETQRATERANRRRAWPRWLIRSFRLSLFLAPVAAIGITGLWLWQTGRLETLENNFGGRLLQFSADIGLEVQEVMVEGRTETDRDALMAALQVDRGDPILSFDPDTARAGLERLPWVATATVERRLPDTIFVRLTERRPMALWQRDGRFALIDVDGAVLTERDLGRYTSLPIIVGPDAPRHAPELLDLFPTVPTLAKRIDAAVRVSERRWDLRLDNGVVIRLPETEIAAALRQLDDLEKSHPFLDRDIVAVDLRLPDRLVVQTSAQASQRRRVPEEKI